MARVSMAIIIFLGSAALMFVPIPAHSMNITLGVNAYYAWWDPAWRNVNGEFKPDPLLMWGPSVTLSFEGGYYVSLVYLQNRTNPSDANYTVRGGGSGGYTLNIDTAIERDELELTAGYRLSDSVRMFAGAKYMKYVAGGRDTDATITGAVPFTLDAINSFYAESAGAGAGLLYFTQVSSNTLLSMSASIIYALSTVMINDYRQIGATYTIGPVSDKNIYNAVGGNAGLNISYFVRGTGIMLTLGGRFQLLKYLPIGDARTLEGDIYYGVMVAAGHTF